MQKLYLLGHSVETNERFYSHMETDSLVDFKDILNRACQTNGAPDASNEAIHTYTHQNSRFWTNKKHQKAHKY
jgi:hypothetical protein